MNLPLQVPPTLRQVSTVKLSGIRGIELSNLACDLCCQSGGGIACGAIPYCSCPLQKLTLSEEKNMNLPIQSQPIVRGYITSRIEDNGIRSSDNLCQCQYGSRMCPENRNCECVNGQPRCVE